MKARASDFTIELGRGLRLSARRLWVENLLITANSGGGKSVAGRQLMEQAAAHCAMVVLDNKGEFWSLREAIDVILVGRKGELPIDVAIAADLARFVREQGCRVVIDLSGTDEETKHAFVAAFVTALLGLPDELCVIPLLVYVSEAQLLAPEEGRPLARKAIRDLATLGRQKRICTVLDTQRLAEVAKAVIGSVTNNMMIGRLSSDVDLARATAALGVSGRNAKQLAAQMKRFEPGWFMCQGQAFDRDGTTDDEGNLVPVRTNPKTRTRHVDPAEDFDLVPPPPSASVAKLVAALASRAAETKAGSTATKAELADARAELQRTSGKATRGTVTMEKSVYSTLIARARSEGYDEGYADGVAAGHSEGVAAGIRDVLDGVEPLIEQALVVGKQMRAVEASGRSAPAPARTSAPKVHRSRKSATSTIGTRPAKAQKVVPAGDGDGAPQRILMVVLAHPGRVSLARVAIMARVSTQKSTMRNALSKLRASGDITTSDGEAEATAKARRENSNVPPLPSGRELLVFWRSELGEGAPRQLFDTFVEHRGPMTYACLAERSGVRNDKSTMRNALSKLRGLGLVTKGSTPQLHPELVDALEKVPRKKARAA